MQLLNGGLEALLQGLRQLVTRRNNFDLELCHGVGNVRSGVRARDLHHARTLSYGLAGSI